MFRRAAYPAGSGAAVGGDAVMETVTPAPVQVTGLAAARLGWQFVRDPLIAMRESDAAHGPFAMVSLPLPFVRSPKLVLLGLPLILTAGASFNGEVLSNPTAWRTVSVLPGGPKNSAARRLSGGIVRMTGRRHAHYRGLLLPALRKGSIDALGEDMARLAQEEVAAWPVGETVDLWDRARHLMRTFAIGLLFGGDRQRGYPIADMINRLLAAKWSLRTAGFPVDLPITPYGRMLRGAERLERSILAWIDHKRGHLDGHDLLSIVVNNPDEDGHPAGDATLAGHVPTLFGAAYETCQNTLIWTLILLAQHPGAARELVEELDAELNGAPPVLERIATLPRLDAVVKESMRILPPVPIQLRVAQEETTLAGHPVPKGARVVLSGFLTNRNPQLYPQPDCFRPERWAAINPNPYEYSVFSGGPRSCPGYWFGLSVIKVALAAILTRYRFALVPQARIDYKVRVGMAPRRSVPAILHPQDGAFAAAPIRGNLRNLVGSMPLP